MDFFPSTFLTFHGTVKSMTRTITLEPGARRTSFADVANAVGVRAGYLLLDIASVLRNKECTTEAHLDEEHPEYRGELPDLLDALRDHGFIRIE